MTSFKRPKVAVLPVAGFGTRMLPLSKSVPKEMLPLADKPVIQYVVEEAVAAGIEHVVLVTHSQKSAIENYFDSNAELDAVLRAKGKVELADSLNFVPEGVRITAVRQSQAKGLGHAVYQACAVVGEQPFAVLLPDVVMNPYDTEYKSDNLAAMLDRFEKSGCSQILVNEVEWSQVDKYGIAKPAQALNEVKPNDVVEVLGFVEKPAQDSAPSNLSVVGRYVFDSKLFELLKDAKAGVGGEIQLTDSMNQLQEFSGLEAVVMTGSSVDAGDMQSYLEAFCQFAQLKLGE